MSHSIDAHHGHNVEQEVYDKTLFGFWIYIMTDCVLFSVLFATYFTLHTQTYGGPSGKDLFDLPFVLSETLILLTSSFTCGLGLYYAQRMQKGLVLLLFGITFLLGLSFLTLELTEFTHLVQEGNSWERSAFLSSFFTLVGCHGFHITCGLIWMSVMFFHIIFKGFIPSTLRRLSCLSLFWHFLDVVWIFIFTVVYLMGVI